MTSSFEYFPGLPLYYSRDLVHWWLIGHALTRASQLSLEVVGASEGIYAATLRFHEGVFYLVATNVTRGGNFFVTTRDPAASWSEPTWLEQRHGCRSRRLRLSHPYRQASAALYGNGKHPPRVHPTYDTEEAGLVVRMTEGFHHEICVTQRSGARCILVQ